MTLLYLNFVPLLNDTLQEVMHFKASTLNKTPAPLTEGNKVLALKYTLSMKRKPVRSDQFFRDQYFSPTNNFTPLKLTPTKNFGTYPDRNFSSCLLCYQDTRWFCKWFSYINCYIVHHLFHLVDWKFRCCLNFLDRNRRCLRKSLQVRRLESRQRKNKNIIFIVRWNVYFKQ